MREHEVAQVGVKKDEKGSCKSPLLGMDLAGTWDLDISAVGLQM
jgi:hypothetical protein